MTAALSNPFDDAPKARQKHSHLPALVHTPTGVAPQEPLTIEDTGVDAWVLHDLALKLISTVPHLSTETAAERLRLALPIVEKIFWQLKHDELVEVLGQSGEFGYRYAATDRGREQARRSMEVCGYVGPAPVSLSAYNLMLDFQTGQRTPASLESVQEALEGLVLPEATVEVAALAAQSSRSLFLFGPAGNGKTTLGRQLHNVQEGDLWIPHCFCLDNNIVRIFDPGYHKALDESDRDAPNQKISAFNTTKIDRRWVRVRPPFVVAGGEMTIAELDLSFNAMRYYEAPPHLKANGGTFLIDDFGRQRMEPHELLNRWIIPLEHQTDHLTLVGGQKIEVPFRLMLIIATNLAAEVADPAFLRRMGYRVHVSAPDAATYAEIFRRYATNANLEVPAGLIEQLLERYRAEGRELRGSEPRDLIERVREICQLRRRPFELTPDVLATAWSAYFGEIASLPAK